MKKRVFARMEKVTRGLRPDYAEYLLKKLKVAENCWCPLGIGHPSIHNHTNLCIEISEYLKVMEDF